MPTRYRRIPVELHKKAGRKCLPIEEEKINQIVEMRQNRYTLKEITNTTGLTLWKVKRGEFFFPARANHTSRPRTNPPQDMATTSTSETRARSASRPGETEEQRNKRYTFGSHPPRHATGGLLSSWLDSQHVLKDGWRWTPRCSPHPRWLGDHVVAQKSALAPGMVSDSLTSKCRNASCWKVLFRLAGVQDQTPSHREGRRIHKVRDTCPSTLDNWAATPSSSKTTRLPSQDTTVTNHFFVSTATAVAQFVNPTTEQAEPKWLLCYYTPTEASIFGNGNIGFPQHSKSPRQRWEPGLAEALTPLRRTTRTITRPSPGMAEEASPEGARRSKL